MSSFMGEGRNNVSESMRDVRAKSDHEQILCDISHSHTLWTLNVNVRRWSEMEQVGVGDGGGGVKVAVCCCWVIRPSFAA